MMLRRHFMRMLPFLAAVPAAGAPLATRGPSAELPTADFERIIEYLQSRNDFLVDSICKLGAENERLRDYRDRVEAAAPPTREELEKLLRSVTTEEATAAEAFYCGQQWDMAIVQERQNAGRPCLVFNKLIAIGEALTAAIESSGKPLTGDQRMGLILFIVRKCGDSQRMYNYCKTSMVESHRSHPELALRFFDMAEECAPKIDGSTVKIQQAGV